MNVFRWESKHLIKELYQPKFLIGASLLRIALGIITLYIYLIHYQQRYALWHDSGYLSHAEYLETTITLPFSLYAYHTSSIYFDIIFHLGIIVAILFTLGYRTGVTSLFQFVFIWSLFERNGVILDGGDNILRIVLFYFIFIASSHYFSIQPSVTRKGTLSSFPEVKKIRNLIHNLAVFACAFQLIILYFMSGIYQVMGEMWQNGTALYYILQVEQFSMPYAQELLSSNLYLMVFATYFSIVIKLGFPFMLWNRYTKYIAIVCMFSFHIGIMFGMGLITFSLIMIALECILISDTEYRTLRHRISLMPRLILSWMRYRTRSLRRQSYITRKRMIIFYDSWCPLCQQVARRIRAIDTLGLIKLKTFRDPFLVNNYKIDPQAANERMIGIIEENKQQTEGFSTFFAMFKRIPLMWWSLPFLWIALKTGLGSTLYDSVASSRKIIPVGHCEDDCSIGEQSGKEKNV
ncbi:DCC1-like thiol-disulfide oxidoreductase family protein [Salsuginibacillus kocurii]|uniref:DCC1-like thiol-disulfide oxidoreductase family protein n=1 Tax=Salsuginibacillus kocurii TaxID=427078 RepID=UPI00037A68D6|nr:DCC1-like thiol-disulfide oxidoreductase family protein [Salsuginibacillus kocurii]